MLQLAELESIFGMTGPSLGGISSGALSLLLQEVQALDGNHSDGKVSVDALRRHRAFAPRQVKTRGRVR